MAFKMKAGKEGPMKKNFSSVFKKDKKTLEKLRINVEFVNRERDKFLSD